MTDWPLIEPENPPPRLRLVRWRPPGQMFWYPATFRPYQIRDDAAQAYLQWLKNYTAELAKNPSALPTESPVEVKEILHRLYAMYGGAGYLNRATITLNQGTHTMPSEVRAKRSL